MPKIIKDLEETIKQCAVELFIHYGYNQVDMKMISKKSGIAVGTLYNYYANKKSLYTTVLKESWQNTFHKLDVVNKLNASPREMIDKFIRVLYEDIDERKGLGKALVNNLTESLKEDETMVELKNGLFSRIEAIINANSIADSLAKCTNIENRLAATLFNSMLTMFEIYPNNKEENIKFLVELMKLSIKQ